MKFNSIRAIQHIKPEKYQQHKKVHFVSKKVEYKRQFIVHLRWKTQEDIYNKYYENTFS
jgi:hypothetical protein